MTGLQPILPGGSTDGPPFVPDATQGSVIGLGGNEAAGC
jgi:hypothetical protein